MNDCFATAALVPANRGGRIRLPSLFWRATAIATVLALIGCDPAFDRLWTARAQVVPPPQEDPDATRITEYRYDLDGRLIQLDSPEGTINYAYEVATERLARTWTDSSETAYGYDLNGSMIHKTEKGSTIVYTCNLANKLSSVAANGATNSFLHNDGGIRVRSASSSGITTRYLIDGNNHTGYAQILEEATTQGGAPSRSYAMGDDVLGEGGSGTNSVRWLLYDGHGSTRQLVASDASVSQQYNYSAYGETTGQSFTPQNLPETSLLYCGEQFDVDLQMYNLRARFYSPATGTFNQRDKFAGNGFDPQSLHKYAYANCDPINGCDPSGWFSITEKMVTMTVICILAVIALDVGFHSFAGTGYTLTEQDLTNPRKPYRALIIKAAKDNRLKPEFVAAVILAELSDLGIGDYTMDIPGAILGDASIGVGQIKPSTVGTLRPELGKGSRIWAAWRPKTAIPLVAEYIRFVADDAVEQDVDEMWYGATRIAMSDFRLDGSTWTLAMEKVMAFNYTQRRWSLRQNAENGNYEFVEKPKAGRHGEWVLIKCRELQGKFQD